MSTPPLGSSARTLTGLTFLPLPDLPLIQPGDDLGALLAGAAAAAGLALQDSDILVVAQKIVSKAENRFVRLREVTPSPQALELARLTGKDPRLVEVILWDTAEVIRARHSLLIVAHRLGFICANAGVDHSNVGADEDLVLRLPADRTSRPGDCRHACKSWRGPGRPSSSTTATGAPGERGRSAWPSAWRDCFPCRICVASPTCSAIGCNTPPSAWPTRWPPGPAW